MNLCTIFVVLIVSILVFLVSSSLVLVYPVLDLLIIRYNTSWCIVEDVVVSNIGTSDFKLNASMTIYDMPSDSVVTLYLYIKKNKNFIPFGQPLKHDVCDFIKNDRIIYDNLLKYSNLPKRCPAEHKSYYITNYQMSFGNLANLLPIGEYRLEMMIDRGQENLGLHLIAYIRALQALTHVPEKDKQTDVRREEIL